MLDAESPALFGRHGDALLDAALFSGNRSVIKSVWIGGWDGVSNGVHPMREGILDRYKFTLNALLRAQ